MGALDGNQTNGKGSKFDAGGISSLGPISGGTILAGNGLANQPTLEGAASGSPVVILAQGTDANISLNLIPKGTGNVELNGGNGNLLGNNATFNGEVAAQAIQSNTPVIDNEVVGSLTTVGNGTITAALLQGLIVSRGGSQTGAFTDTTDTAANIISAFGGNTGTVRVRIINNTADTQTIAGGSGVTISGTATLATNTFRDFLLTMTSTTVTLTNIGSGSN